MRKKKILIFFIGLLCFHFSRGQDEGDALRYSFLNPGGDARVQAIGGAGISLGGDASLMSSNPASIGLFKSNDFSFTPGVYSQTQNGNYLGTQGPDVSKSKFFVQQASLVFSNGTQGRRRNTTKWKNVSFGLGINRLANFNGTKYYEGDNVNSSLSDNYLIDLDNGNYGNSQADNDEIASNFPFGLSQAYLTGLIGPEMDNNNDFVQWGSLPAQILDAGKPIHQSNSIDSRGGIDEFSLSVAGNYDDRFYIGVGLNIPSINYHRTGTYRETNTKDPSSVLNHYEVVDRLHTEGAGINGKLGIIYVVNPRVRAGLTFHSPTLYSMKDTYTTTMTTNTTDLNTLTSTTYDITGGYPGQFDYSMTTPLRVGGGLTYIVGAAPGATQQGFVTLDLEYINYASTRFRFDRSGSTADDKAYETSLNQTIKDSYKGATNVRLGGELKFDKLFGRLGLAYMGNPYDIPNLKGDQMQYSAGLGYRNRGFFIDLAFVYIDKGEQLHQPYIIKNNSFGSKSPDPAVLKGHAENIILTLGFQL